MALVNGATSAYGGRSLPTLHEPLLMAVPKGAVGILLWDIIVAYAATIVYGGILVQVTQSAATAEGTSA